VSGLALLRIRSVMHSCPGPRLTATGGGKRGMVEAKEASPALATPPVLTGRG